MTIVQRCRAFLISLALSGLLIAVLFADHSALWVAIGGILTVSAAVMAVFWPQLALPAVHAVHRLAQPLAAVLSMLVMLLTYILVIVPVALCARLLGRDMLFLREPKSGMPPGWSGVSPTEVDFDKQY